MHAGVLKGETASPFGRPTHFNMDSRSIFKPPIRLASHFQNQLHACILNSPAESTAWTAPAKCHTEPHEGDAQADDAGVVRGAREEEPRAEGPEAEADDAPLHAAGRQPAAGRARQQVHERHDAPHEPLAAGGGELWQKKPTVP